MPARPPRLPRFRPAGLVRFGVRSPASVVQAAVETVRPSAASELPHSLAGTPAGRSAGLIGRPVGRPAGGATATPALPETPGETSAWAAPGANSRAPSASTPTLRDLRTQ